MLRRSPTWRSRFCGAASLLCGAALLSPLGLAACGADPAEKAEATADPWAAGPYPVGHRQVALPGLRPLTVELWYPAQAGGVGAPMPEAYAEDDAQQAIYEGLIESAPAGCPTTEAASARDAAVEAGAWPAVVFSHCSGCARFSSATVMERLASHGFVIAAPDHTGDTLWDRLDGDGAPLDTATLELRALDQAAVLDALLSPPDAQWAEVAELVDAERIGAMGHSFGSVTTGLLSQRDDRVRAAIGVAAPMENPLLRGVSMAELGLPLLLVLAQEDNSIMELGNNLLRDNATAAAGPTWLVEVPDAGHWSVSDLAGLTPSLMPGCGEAERQTAPGESFSYLPPEDGMNLLGALSVAFFNEHLRGRDGAFEALDLSPAAATRTQTVSPAR